MHWAYYPMAQSEDGQNKGHNGKEIRGRDKNCI